MCIWVLFCSCTSLDTRTSCDGPQLLNSRCTQKSQRERERGKEADNVLEHSTRSMHGHIAARRGRLSQRLLGGPPARRARSSANAHFSSRHLFIYLSLSLCLCLSVFSAILLRFEFNVRIYYIASFLFANVLLSHRSANAAVASIFYLSFFYIDIDTKGSPLWGIKNQGYLTRRGYFSRAKFSLSLFT